MANEVIRETAKDEEGNEFEYDVELYPDVEFGPDVFGVRKENKVALFANLEKAISAGNVTKERRKVDFEVKDNEGTIVKVYRQFYTKAIAVNEAGALALPIVEGDEDRIWGLVSDRADANNYQSVYVRLRNAAQGPEKVVKKMAKLFEGLSEAQKLAAKEALAAAGLV